MARHSNPSFTHNIDWITILLYAACVSFGLFSIYAAVFNPDDQTKLLDFNNSAGKQAVFIGTSLVIVVIVLVLDHRVWEVFAPVIYGFFLVSLVAVLLFAPNIKGSESMFRIGSFGLQPAEFAKTGVALMLARFMSQQNISLTRFKDLLSVFGIILLPAVLIILSKEVGVALVYASFQVMLYREGMSGVIPFVQIAAATLFLLTLFFAKLYILAGIAAIALFVFYVVVPRYNRNRKTAIPMGLVCVAMVVYMFSVNYIYNNVLKPHHRNRIQVLFDPNIDRRGIGWNVTQSKIAIGSGGLWGKGFLEGTQTKFNFVPEQHTDFIFCTVGEEHGFVGSTIIVCLYLALMLRVVALAERQRTRFARIYGYSVAGILFFHFAVNIGMTLGLMVVVGIPLPFFSYGGSSLWSFTLMLFILLKMDAQRPYTLSRD
jgi:rod shape determining protein RodA